MATVRLISRLKIAKLLDICAFIYPPLVHSNQPESDAKEFKKNKKTSELIPGPWKTSTWLNNGMSG